MLVYSPDDIQHGRIPAPGAHTEAAERFISLVSEETFRTGKLAEPRYSDIHLDALVYGSVARNDYTIFSDLDTMVVRDNAHPSTAPRLVALAFLRILREFNVHTALLMVSPQWYVRDHTLNPCLAHEVQRAQAAQAGTRLLHGTVIPNGVILKQPDPLRMLQRERTTMHGIWEDATKAANVHPEAINQVSFIRLEQAFSLAKKLGSGVMGDNDLTSPDIGSHPSLSCFLPEAQVMGFANLHPMAKYIGAGAFLRQQPLAF